MNYFINEKGLINACTAEKAIVWGLRQGPIFILQYLWYSSCDFRQALFRGLLPRINVRSGAWSAVKGPRGT